jgi:membrane protease YdiL (CAAX protease family)
MMEPSRPRRDPFGVVLIVVFAFLLVFTAALVLASFPAGLYAVFVGHLSNQFSFDTVSRPYMYVGPFFQWLPFTASVGTTFLALTAVYLGMLTLSWRQGTSPRAALSASLTGGAGRLFTSPFLVAIISIGFLTFTATLLDALSNASGFPVGSLPTVDPLAQFLGLAVAPLVEELGFRLMIIGAVAVVISLGRPSKDLLRVLWRPSVAFEREGARKETTLVLAAALALSSLVFGYAHVAAGWDVGKLFEASYGGVVLGYLYIKYGFHMAVLCHWGIDYFGSAFAFFGQAAYGIPWNSSTAEYLMQRVVDIDLLLLFGLACFVLVIYVGIRRFVKPQEAPAVVLGSP